MMSTSITREPFIDKTVVKMIKYLLEGRNKNEIWEILRQINDETYDTFEVFFRERRK